MTEKQKQAHTVKAAREYVKKQLAIMKAHGSATKLSRVKYDAIVREVADATR